MALFKFGMCVSKSKRKKLRRSSAVCGAAISEARTPMFSASDDVTVRLWYTETEERIGLPRKGHTGAVNCVSFRPETRWVVSGSYIGTLHL